MLWERGPCTVGEVREELMKSREVGYTGVLKMLQIMNRKRLVKRNEKQRAHVYQARQKRETMQKALVDQLVTGAFGGSAAALVKQVLSTRKFSRAELAEIRKLL